MDADMGAEIRARLLGIEQKLDALAGQGIVMPKANVVSINASPKSIFRHPDTGAEVEEQRKSLKPPPPSAFRHSTQTEKQDEEVKDSSLNTEVLDDDRADIRNAAHDTVTDPRGQLDAQAREVPCEQAFTSQDDPQRRPSKGSVDGGDVGRGISKLDTMTTRTGVNRGGSTGLLPTATPMGLAERLGFDDWHARVEAKIETIKKRRAWKIVHSPSFQLAVSAVILVQAAVIGASASNSLGNAAYGEAHQTWMEYTSFFFCFFFVLELLVKVYVEKICFIFGPEWKWNMFDTLLVTMSIFDMATHDGESGKFGGATVGRILRLSRFFVLMRISRVMRQLPSLRIILLAILDSMISLVWCFLFIVFIMYVFAVLVVYGAADCFRHGDACQTDAQLDTELRRWWGGIYRSMVTLFMTIAGGVDWYEVIEPLRKMAPVYEILFLFYVFFMMFGVLNVVVGAFVATTGQIASKDREAIVKFQQNELDSYMARIKLFFKDADVDKSGTLSWEEFRAHLEDPKVQAYFQALELDVSQAHILFDLLDTDHSNSVTIEEFIDGCIRLRGQARSIDLNMLVYMCQRMFESMNDFVSTNQETRNRLSLIERAILEKEQMV